MLEVQASAKSEANAWIIAALERNAAINPSEVFLTCRHLMLISSKSQDMGLHQVLNAESERLSPNRF